MVVFRVSRTKFLLMRYGLENIKDDLPPAVDKLPDLQEISAFHFTVGQGFGIRVRHVSHIRRLEKDRSLGQLRIGALLANERKQLALAEHREIPFAIRSNV